MTAGAPKLEPALRSRHVAMIALGGVVGAGLFVGSSAAILQAGPAAVVSYAFAGAIAFFIMRMLGEMAVARPGLGSFNAYVRAALGSHAGFVTGWLYWYFWIIAVGAETIAGASLLGDFVALPVWSLGLVLIALLTGTNLFSVRVYGEFEYWFSLLKVVAIVAFIVVAGVHFGFARGADAGLAAPGGFIPHGGLAMLATVPTVIFSLTGSEIASIAAAESDDPAGNVARAARTVALRITVFYVLAVGLITATVPWSTLQAGQSPFVAALAVIGIPGAAPLMQVIILVAVLSCLNSGLYVTSRTLFELADAGAAPRALVATSRRGVPTRAILLGAGAGAAAALASIASPGLVFAFLLDTSGAVILFVYALIALAQIRSRRLREAAGQPSSLPVWLFPWLSYATIAAIGVVLLAMAVLPGRRVELLASGASIAVAFAASFLPERRMAASAIS